MLWQVQCKLKTKDCIGEHGPQSVNNRECLRILCASSADSSEAAERIKIYPDYGLCWVTTFLRLLLQIIIIISRTIPRRTGSLCQILGVTDGWIIFELDFGLLE